MVSVPDESFRTCAKGVAAPAYDHAGVGDTVGKTLIAEIVRDGAYGNDAGRIGEVEGMTIDVVPGLADDLRSIRCDRGGFARNQSSGEKIGLGAAFGPTNGAAPTLSRIFPEANDGLTIRRDRSSPTVTVSGMSHGNDATFFCPTESLAQGRAGPGESHQFGAIGIQAPSAAPASVH